MKRFKVKVLLKRKNKIIYIYIYISPYHGVLLRGSYFNKKFKKDSRITEYLQSHVGLQLHTCFINFDLVMFQKN